MALLFVLSVLSVTYFFIGGMCANIYLESGASSFKSILAGLFWPVMLLADWIDS